MYIKRTAAVSAKSISFIISLIFSNSPVSSTEYPGGRESPLTILATSSIISPVDLPFTSAVTATYRDCFSLSMLTGPVEYSIFATAERGTSIPAGVFIGKLSNIERFFLNRRVSIFTITSKSSPFLLRTVAFMP